MVADKELYENGEATLAVYEDGRLFIAADHCGMFITPLQLLDLHGLLTAFLEEAVETGELERDER